MEPNHTAGTQDAGGKFGVRDGNQREMQQYDPAVWFRVFCGSTKPPPTRSSQPIFSGTETFSRPTWQRANQGEVQMAGLGTGPMSGDSKEGKKKEFRSTGEGSGEPLGKFVVTAQARTRRQGSQWGIRPGVFME